jgi:hypothetical protein
VTLKGGGSILVTVFGHEGLVRLRSVSWSAPGVKKRLEQLHRGRIVLNLPVPEIAELGGGHQGITGR